MNPPPPAEGLASRLFLGPTLRTQPDRRLVTLVRDGYEAAFDEIVRRYGKALGRYAAAIVGGRSEDVTQDAFSKALLALRRDSDAEIELRPWLYRIVRNTALNDLRDRPPEAAELDSALAAGSISAAEQAERREEIADLMQRLRSLPESQRAAIVMRELEGLSHEEIAAALGMSGGAARQAIHRARTALRDGVGLLIPLPIVRTLIEHGAEAGAAVGAGGAAVAAGGAIGAGGAGTALKVGVVTAVLAGSVGTGVAIRENREHDRQVETAAAAVSSGAQPAAETAAAVPGPNGPRSAPDRASEAGAAAPRAPAAAATAAKRASSERERDWKATTTREAVPGPETSTTDADTAGPGRAAAAEITARGLPATAPASAAPDPGCAPAPVRVTAAAPDRAATASARDRAEAARDRAALLLPHRRPTTRPKACLRLPTARARAHSTAATARAAPATANTGASKNLRDLRSPVGLRGQFDHRARRPSRSLPQPRRKR